MLCLARTSSTQVELNEAVLRRGILSVEQQNKIRDQLWRMMIGLDGEQRADRFWEDLQLEMEHYLFHNFETVNRIGFTHQMDTIFICSKFVLIVELKHIAGDIMYDTNSHQLLRTYNGETQAMGDPFHQVTRHVEWFEHFLWEIGVQGLPVLSSVIITTTNSVLKQMPAQFHVFKLEGLRFKLAQWLKYYPDAVDQSILKHVQQLLLTRHQRKKAKLPIDNLKLRRGVLCKVCGMKMSYHFGVFSCTCGERCRDGFQRGLADYRLLVDEWITNRAFREFFEIDDPYSVSHLLKRLALKSEGTKKDRRYYIPEDIASYKLYKRGSNGTS